MNAYSADDIVVVEVPLKRGKAKVVRIRTSNYPTPARGWADADFQAMAVAQVDKWLILGSARITHVIPCR